MPTKKPKATRARPCAVCTSPRRTTIENAIRRGQTSAAIANTYGIGRHSVRIHGESHIEARVAVSSSPPPPVDDAFPPDASPTVRARVNADGARARLRQAEGAGLPIGDVVKLRNAATHAERLYAQVTGAIGTKLSEETILRSAPWKALIDELGELLEPHPEALRAVVEGLRKP